MYKTEPKLRSALALCCTALCSVVFAVSASATALDLKNLSAEAKGLKIATQTQLLDTGWHDAQGNMQLIMFDNAGKELTRRNVKTMFLEQPNYASKTLGIFDDSQHTVFLTITDSDAQDKQWIYLPAMGKAKRISSNNKASNFMGSEFTYEDLSAYNVNKYTYTYLRNEKVNGVDTYVIEAKPKDPDSGYSKIITWTNADNFQLTKREFFDRQGESFKTQELSGLKQYLNKYWRPTKLVMKNKKTLTSSEIVWQDLAFKTGVKTEMFDPDHLAHNGKL